MNIDKDIKIVKEIITHKDDYDVCFGYRIAKPYSVGAEEIQAISNVLSELEKYKKAYELETYERQKFINELETYKKIAEKLAEECTMFKRIQQIDFDNEYSNGLVYMTKEEVLYWARKEVENEQNNNT